MEEYVKYLKSFDIDIINSMLVLLESGRVSIDEIEVTVNEIGRTDIVPFRIFDKEKRIENLLKS